MRLAVIISFFLAMLPDAALAASPTVVELYQSQGCSSCPPAIANVNLLADRPDILALTFAVTYWDRLGWKDTFANAAFTQRQYDYAQGLHHANVYTPQVVIDGRADLDGLDRDVLRGAVAKAAPKLSPTLTVAAGLLTIGAGPPQDADVWLVRYDPRVQDVAIGAGENSGVTIAHRNVVHGLVHLGAWSGAAARLAIPAGDNPDWKAAILVQGKKGGPILAALKL